MLMDFGTIPPEQAVFIVGKPTTIYVMRTDDIINNEITFHLRWADAGENIDTEVIHSMKISDFMGMSLERIEQEIRLKMKKAVDDARNKQDGL
jgi:hypothetical protein